MINVCVPVLKRYDLLRGLLLSLERGSVKPDHVYVVNNGRDEAKYNEAVEGNSLTICEVVPKVSLGVAASWNWFIDNVQEERVIVNDDIIFGREDLGKLVAGKEDLIFAEDIGFSCFVLRDSCVAKIGKFDESISPGYGYYEDDDYLQRIDGRGTKPPQADLANVKTEIVHLKSQTLAASTPAEIEEHHRKFCIAQANYIKKWNLEDSFR